MILAVGNDGQFAKLCEVLGHAGLDRATSASPPTRRACATSACSIRCCATSSPSGAARELIAALDTAGVPCGPINTVPEVFKEPQVKHRADAARRAASDRGSRAAGGQPAQFRRCAARLRPRAAAARPAHRVRSCASLGWRRPASLGAGEPYVAPSPALGRRDDRRAARRPRRDRGGRARAADRSAAGGHSQSGSGAALVAARRVSALLDHACRRSSTSSPSSSPDGAGTARSSFTSMPRRRGQQASIRPASRRSGSRSRRPLPTRPRPRSTSSRASCSRPAASSAALHAAVTARWGERGVVELTGVIGYYTMVSMTLNAHEIPLPDGASPPLAPPPGGGLTTLPACGARVRAVKQPRTKDGRDLRMLQA